MNEISNTEKKTKPHDYTTMNPDNIPAIVDVPPKKSAERILRENLVRVRRAYWRATAPA